MKIHRLTKIVKVFETVEEVVKINERGTVVANDHRFFKKPT